MDNNVFYFSKVIVFRQIQGRLQRIFILKDVAGFWPFLLN